MGFHHDAGGGTGRHSMRLKRYMAYLYLFLTSTFGFPYYTFSFIEC